MTDRTRVHVAVMALAATLLVVAAVSPAMVGARPAREIPVVSAPGDVASPTADAWEEVPEATVPMASAPSGLPKAGSTSVSTVHVAAATTSERVYVRLRWQDPTVDRNATDPREFVDAAAIQMPVNTTTQPAIAMGSSRNLVNVWYWQANGGTQELLAGGPGSTTELSAVEVTTTSARVGSGEDAAWSVVFSRQRAADVPNRTAITDERDLDVAFAVWNGGAMERSGRKAVSEWHYLPFGPAPQGPPFQTLLWAVAGLAIVAVVALTIVGIRRAKGGA